MSFSQTRSALINALRLPNTPVIALHGLWGSGKTHLWRDIASELEQDKSITHLYVSCMAYSSIASLKSAVITMLLSRAPSLARHGESLIKVAVGLLNTRLPKELHFSASLSDIQIFLPKLKSIIPTNSLIVFDDIERATDLDIRELLGFVSFLTDQLDVRVLLILNREKLGRRHEAWEQLREKVISLEIALKTEPSDCVAIGLGQMPNEHFAAFASRINQLGITNIRALQHMRRVYDALSAAQRLDDDQWSQLIPSIVLFTALHFNIIDNAPSTEQALNQFTLLNRDTKELTESEKRARQLLADYNLGTPDNFETEVLVPYLRTGHLDTNAFTKYIVAIHLRRRRQHAEAVATDFFVRYRWDDTVSNDGLLSLITSISPYLDVLDARSATRLAEAATQLNNPILAQSIIDEWIKTNRTAIAVQQLDEHHFEVIYDTRELHPDIRGLYKERHAELYAPLLLREAIEYLYLHNSWGTRHSHPLEIATHEELENLIRKSEPEFRKRMFWFFAKYLSKQVQGGSFQATAVRFAEACRNIVAQEPNSRLSSIIRRAFEDMELAPILTESSPSTMAGDEGS